MIHQYLCFALCDKVYLVRSHQELQDQEIERLSALLDLSRVETSE